MNLTRKAVAAALVLSIFVFTFASRASADDMMDSTLRGSLYGGIIGGIIGSAIVLLTDEPEDHLGYIPTGIGIGVLLGTTYGVVSGAGVIETVGDVRDGKFAFRLPAIKSSRAFDKKTNKVEVVNRVDLLRLKF